MKALRECLYLTIVYNVIYDITALFELWIDSLRGDEELI